MFVLGEKGERGEEEDEVVSRSRSFLAQQPSSLSRGLSRWPSERAARFPSRGNIKEGRREKRGGIRKLRKRSTGDAAAGDVGAFGEERDVSGAKREERGMRNVAILSSSNKLAKFL